MDVTTPCATGGRSSGTTRRHALGLDDVERVPWGNHEITTPAQTALDLARTLPFTKAVTAVDQAIWADRPGGPLTTIEEILRRLGDSRPRRGDSGNDVSVTGKDLRQALDDVLAGKRPDPNQRTSLGCNIKWKQ